MHQNLTTHTRWLLPAVLILFILEIFTLPFVIELTYAGRSEAPDHTLTYTPGSLRWDSRTDIERNGAARLSLFDARYGKTVNAENGDKVVAPGTDGSNIVRLKNSADKSVHYTAVLYESKESASLPVEARLRGNGFADTTAYRLPRGVKDADVLRAVRGQIGRGEIQDFDVDWLWDYEDGAAQDAVDTYLGDKAAKGNADDVTVGLYLVVEDDNGDVLPSRPQTGDTGMDRYIALMVISGALLIFLLIARRREKKCEG